MASQNSDTIVVKLENILKSVAEAENIVKYEIFPDLNQTKGEGFVSEFFRGKIVNSENKKSTEVAIKIAPEKGIMDSKTTYKNEVHFYSNVFSQLDKFQQENNVSQPFDNIPKYFTGSIEPKKEFVAMEDLTNQNYKTIDKSKYFDGEHLQLIFKTYGKFHALSFIFKQQQPELYHSLIQDFSDVLGILVETPGLQYHLNEVYQAALKTFDPVAEKDILTQLKNIEDIRKAVSESRKYTGNNSCLLHGDCWSNNMLFKYEDSGTVEDLKLIDFQLCLGSTPVHDLAYMFYAGASKKDMDKLDYYLSLYHLSFSDFAKELQGNIEEIFSLDDFKAEWKKYSHFGLLFGMHLWTTKLMNREEILSLLSNENLPREQYGEIWTTALNKSRASEAFQERARNICLHAVEYGIV